MKSKYLQVLALSVAALSTVLVACGGGGGGGGSATSFVVSGTAATGAAFTDATITVVDSRGITVGTSSTVGADGTYSITLASGSVAPFILTASRTSADGSVESLVSVVPTAAGTAATANITPVTTLIASRLSTSGDPLKLAAEVAAGSATVNASTLATKVAEVQATLATLLSATGETGTDPLTGSFAANGTGYDRLLDSIKVSIIPASSTTTSIEVAVKQQQAEGVAPVAIQFTSSAITIPVIPAISASNLVPSGTSALIAQHLAQLNTCFALPTATRVNNPNPTGAGATSADSTNITATQCRDAFIQNAGVISFKSNGYTIGAAPGRSFRGMFYDVATGVVFSQGAYEFTRVNGDIVVSYKSKTVAGDEVFDTFALRLDTDGKLKQIGNQYDYPGGVSAFHQLRKFITLGQSAWDYYSTGYSLNVDHITGGSGVDGSIFDRVEVTTPRGNVLTLKPVAGSSYLPLVKSGTVTRTSFVRLNSVYADSANVADPAVKDTSLFFADRTLFTDAYIATIPAQSVWKFDYFVAGNTGSTPDATQNYKTRARALTIAELQTKGVATLTPTAVTTVSSGADGTGRLPFSGESVATLNWTVGTGALPPTKIQIWGVFNDGTHSGSFNDSANVGSTARTGNIGCSSSGASDYHCQSGLFTTTTLLNGAHLWARDTSGREFASFYAMYQLP